eukprot:365396-Chlamydomonas_euryale.AAC.17
MAQDGVLVKRGSQALDALEALGRLRLVLRACVTAEQVRWQERHLPSCHLGTLLHIYSDVPTCGVSASGCDWHRLHAPCTCTMHVHGAGAHDTHGCCNIQVHYWQPVGYTVAQSPTSVLLKASRVHSESYTASYADATHPLPQRSIKLDLLGIFFYQLLPERIRAD